MSIRSIVARFGLGAGLTKAATVPSCAVCAAYPVLVGPLTAAGMFGAAVVLHNLLVVLAPLNLLFLGASYRRHRRPEALYLAGAGIVLIMLHLAMHVIPWSHPIIRALSPHELQVGMGLIWAGLILLMLGAIADRRAQGRPRPILMQMTAKTTVLGMVILLATATGGLSAQTPTAVADLRDANAAPVGRAVFTQSLANGGVWIEVVISGLSPGVHGIHIHAVGNCVAPAFTSAGGHFNPEGARHGLESPGGPHAGDLPNLVATPGRTVAYPVASYRITLGPGPLSLFDADGSALVVHAQPDDNVSDPAGNAGGRVACGVITRR